MDECVRSARVCVCARVRETHKNVTADFDLRRLRGRIFFDILYVGQTEMPAMVILILTDVDTRPP